MPTVNDVLRLKGQALYTVPADASVLAAVQLMNDRRIGALLVTENGQYVGIFTERDVLTRIVARQVEPDLTRVGEVMTRDLLCTDLFADLDEVGKIMQTRRLRHLPVKDVEDQVVGMISIGDLNAFHVQDKQQTIENLSDYICGRS